MNHLADPAIYPICKDTIVIYESSRVAVDPVLLLWLKVQRNITQTYDCPDFFFRKSRRGICRVVK